MYMYIYSKFQKPMNEVHNGTWDAIKIFAFLQAPDQVDAQQTPAPVAPALASTPGPMSELVAAASGEFQRRDTSQLQESFKVSMKKSVFVYWI